MTAAGLPVARSDVIVLMTGGRDWVWELPIETAFVAVEEMARATLPGPYRFGLVEGECPLRWVGTGPTKVQGSADALAVRVARRLQWHVFESRPGVRGFPAGWDAHRPPPGKPNPAGTIRNDQMIEFALSVRGAHICVGFPTANSKGTWHCMRQARRAGMLVWRVHEDGTIDEQPEIPER